MPAWLDTPAGNSIRQHGDFTLNDLASLLGSFVLKEKRFDVFDATETDLSLGDFARRESKIVARAVDIYQQRIIDAPPAGVLRYIASGYRKSSSTFRKMSLACPEIAREMHWMLRMRCGAFVLWYHAKTHCSAVVKTAAKGCGCCRKDITPDSLEHFFLYCNPVFIDSKAVKVNGNLTAQPLKAARQAVNLKKTAVLLAQAVVDFHFSSGPKNRSLKQLDFVKVAKFSDAELIRLLLGGSGLTIKINNTTCVINKGLSDLADWDPRPGYGGDKCAKESKRITNYLRMLQKLQHTPIDPDQVKRPKRTKLLHRYRFFEAGLRLSSEFLKYAVNVRNSQFWDGAFSSNQRQPPA